MTEVPQEYSTQSVPKVLSKQTKYFYDNMGPCDTKTKTLGSKWITKESWAISKIRFDHYTPGE